MKQQKNGRQNYNWDNIKLDYISNPSSSLKKIADKYKIKLQTVEKKSKADNWYSEKKEYQKALTEDATQRVYAKQTDILERELMATDALTDVICNALKDTQQFNRHIVYRNGQQEEFIFSKYDTKAFLDMTKALKMLVDIKKSLLGITSIEHQERMDIARERLQLERERLELEKQKSDLLKSGSDNHQIGIVILPDISSDDEEDATERAKLIEEYCS